MKSLQKRDFPMTRLCAWKKMGGVLVLCLATAIAAPAQTFTNLVNFVGSNGDQPYMAFVQGRDGNLYGTSELGPPDGEGSVFKITPAGVLTTLNGFDSTDGRDPVAGLVLATDGNFYGTTRDGTTRNAGTVFRITAGGQLTTLYSFCAQVDCTGGREPSAPLLQATDGNFYGTTYAGGTGDTGTVFRITPEGKLETLHSLTGYPHSGLVQGIDGVFYGTTTLGGAHGLGTVFSMTAQGKLVTLYSFCAQTNCSDGSNPLAGLVQGTDGNFYGTTSAGGNDSTECNSGCGTAFTITPLGSLTTLHRFDVAEGILPNALTQATDGNFYGTAYGGGDDFYDCSGGCGTAFTITSTGALTLLHSFQGVDGGYPTGLLQATGGEFYGTTSRGGDIECGCGTVYSLDMGLGPFLALVRGSGKVGQTGGILGQGFTGTTSVSLNGLPAAFTVKSDTFITATVPPGATTGFVTVVTPTGTLTSNVPFRVLQ
jgi:uncharacterized repeat protein (TIGR03803 family)